MSKNIYLFCKGNVSAIPPVYSYALSLAHQEYHVHLICGEISPITKSYLVDSSPNIYVDDLNLDNKSKLHKNYYFRKKVNEKYKNIKNGQVWYCTLDTAIALYLSPFYNLNPFILSVLELYDSASLYTKFFLKNIIKDAEKIVVPEFNRSCIMKVWYNLKNLPIVIPNKPYDIALPPMELYLEEKIEELKNYAGGRKIILYQGLITGHRNLEIFAKVISEFAMEFIFVLTGPVFNDYDNILKTVNKNTNLIYMGNIPAPHHLHFTKVADIGVLKYDFLDLNNIYCAPNKLWEYSAFQLILLGNNIPGLKFYIEKFNAGLIADFENENQMRKIFSRLIVNSEEFISGSSRLFNSIDYDDLINQVVS